jgi:Mrp family chromosome partitioning ATPase
MLNLNDKLQESQTAGGGLVPPMMFGENLKVISLEYMMEDRDDPIIWRGPLKVQAIRQFVADIDWGDLDYLIIDAPPGTGDEPLTVAQNIKDAHALVVTTPQDVALADVRKSLNFCKHVKMEVIGMVENMSGFICPHCNETVEIFKTGGGEKTAVDFGVNFLGSVPIDPKVVVGGDDGNPYLSSDDDSPAVQAFAKVIDNVEQNMNRVKISLENADNGCACGPTCNPDTCAC